MTRSTPRLLALCVLIAFGACTPRDRSASTTPGANEDGDAARPIPVKDADLIAALEDGEKKIKLRVSETTESMSGATEQTAAAKARRLSAAETQKVLDRLPPLAVKDGDQKTFAFRDRSLPPPRTGETIKANFPPDAHEDAINVPKKPVEVLRFAPDGDVALAPHVSVTFNQPMVAVTTHAELAKLPVPVRLSPQPKGEWRWVGTQTVLFASADERMPMATDYSVEIPAGTKSAVGSRLSAVKTFRFSTPPPTVKQFFPYSGPTVTDPIVFVKFDQQIDPKKVLATTTVRSKGQDYALRLASEDEIDADDVVKNYVENAKEGTWIAFRATEPLPGDSEVRVSVGPGTPSEEGPRKTTAAYNQSFRTFGPLEVTRHRCGWSRRCRPGEWWTIEFNNPLNEQTFSEDLVTVEPELSGMVTYASYNTITIRGDSKGRTTYKVKVGADLGDKFGQTLGKDATLSFDVGRADKQIRSTGQNLVSLDPAGGTSFPVYTTNYSSLKVQIYKVEPKDWKAYLAYLEKINGYRRGKAVPPGRQVFNESVKIESQPDEMVETPIDLSPALTEGLGHAVIAIRPKGGKEYERVIAWVQSTRIGLDAFVDRSEMFAWSTRLADGTPQANIELKIHPHGDAATSSEDGLVVMPLPARQASEPSLLVAKQGNDVAILPEHVYWWRGAGSWYRRPAADTMRWHVFDDRKMYKPKEEINIKGWVRMVGMERLGDVEGIPGAGAKITYVIKDAQGNEVVKGKTKLKGLGGFDFTAKLPDAMNLGWAQVILGFHGKAVPGTTHYHSFQVQEFRRPEFEVKSNAGEGPFVLGGSATVKVRAAYYAGGGLPNADLTWRVFAEDASYSPPNWEGWTFGRWRPWWVSYYNSGRRGPAETLQAKTDADGAHRIKVDFEDIAPPEPVRVRAESTVYDVNRQAWTSRANMLVHPSDYYVGVKTPRRFVRKGEPIIVKAVVVNQDGKAIGGRKIAVRSSRMVWKRVKGQWQQVEAEPETKIIKTPKSGDPIEVTFEPEIGGSYKIKAVVQDDRGRPNRSEMTIWMAGGDAPPDRGVAQQQVTMIPNKEIFHAGESAEILIQAPFAPAEGLLTLRRSGVVETKRFHMKESSYTLEIPIEEAYVPNLHVHVDLVGAASRGTPSPGKTLPKRPAYAAGTLNIKVPPVQRTLTVKATPAVERIEPAGKTTVSVEVKDAQGQPVRDAQVALVVVDESVLSLSGYQIPDPLESFYFQRGGDTSSYHQRAYVMLASNKDLEASGDPAPEPDAAAPAQLRLNGAGGAKPASPRRGPLKRAKGKAEGSARGRAADDEMAPMEEKADASDRNQAGGEEDTPIAMRADFRSLVTFSPMVSTDGNGKAQVPIELPDNLTRYRITAVAAAGPKNFGKGESSITARLPLMVRPSPPRFLNYGDEFELPVVLQNQTDDPMTVNVAVRAVNSDITDGGGRQVTVPANDRVEVRFPAAAGQPGIARFQVGGVSGRWTDANQFEFPVWTPATTEAFAMYGVIDKGAVAQPVLPPSDVVPEFGGLEITTSSTAVQALTDSFIYLLEYPYGCSEQIASRVLAVAGLRDVLDAFEAEGLPDEKALVTAVGRDLERLELLQNNDGGFGFWYRGQQSWPWVSIHVAHSMVRAEEKGFEVNDRTKKRSMRYLENIDSHIPHWYSAEAKLIIRSYAVYVRHHAGDSDVTRAKKLIRNYGGVEKMPLETLGFLMPILSDSKRGETELAAMHKHLGNRVTETAAGAHFATSYSDGAHVLLHSDRRADAIILEGLIVDKPKSDLIPKIVTGLLAHRRKGAWSSTQENSFVLLALDKYFRTYEKQTPDFVARVWLGEGYAGDHKFKGRTTERHRIDIPMNMVVASSDTKNLVVSKDGPGRLYYRIGMSYAPKDLALPPMDRGFTVERSYEPVENEDDVRRDADGTWRIRAGAQVRVRLTMVAPTRRYHVALVDPLPAGLEPENPALATTGTLPEDPAASSGNWWWWRTWYEHQNLRDERVEAFTSLLWGGVHQYTYYARATTPGRFVVPPTKAEEMYHPETFGRSGTDRVVVEPTTGTLAKSD